MHQLFPILVLFISSTLLAQTTPAFTYQGRFNHDGVPAQGEYDLRISVHDQETGGTTLTTVQVFEVDVIDGLFILNVPTEDPPGTPIFNGEDRWIEVGFRDGEDTVFDPFTLMPRQLTGYTPLAAHATTAESLTNPPWRPDTLYNLLSNDDEFTHVYINTPSTFFDDSASLVANTKNQNQGGVVISNSELTAEPYLHFATAIGTINDQRYRLAFEGNTGIFKFTNTNGVDAMRLVPNAGLEVLDGGVTADDFVFTSPEIRRMSISPAAWVPAKNLEYTLSQQSNGLRSFIDESVFFSERMVAPINLPDGATIISVKTYFDLKNSAELSYKLVRGNHAATALNLIVYLQDLNQFDNPSPQTALADPSTAIVDNGIFNYFLEVSSQDWGGGAFPDVSIGGTVITYTVNEPD